jgi:hypothetical protein
VGQKLKKNLHERKEDVSQEGVEVGNVGIGLV